MYVRIRRRLSLEEGVGRLVELEGMAGMPFHELETGLYSGKLDRSSFGIYGEWASLLDSYSAYLENGEFDYAVDEVRNFGEKNLGVILSARRLEILSFLTRNKVGSINELARLLRRDIKNVYQDLEQLSRLGLLSLSRASKRSVVPETEVEELSFILG